MDPVLPYVMGAGGAVMAITSYLDLLLAREVAAWPVVKGHLLASELRSAPFGPGVVVAKVHYRYRVGSETYDGDRFTFRRFRYVPEARRALYQVADQRIVDVHYDPLRPERAVLLPGAGYLPTPVLVGGVLLIGIAFVLHFVAAA